MSVVTLVSVVHGIAVAIDALTSKEAALDMTLDEILAKATAISNADDSLIAITQGLAQQIRDNAQDPAKLQALADQLDAETSKVVAAVNANTQNAAPPAA